MSFRKEIKFILHKSKEDNFLKWIQNNGAKLLYKQRNITSIYFDNEMSMMYHDSVEGIVPRKKIRLRKYNQNNNFLFEMKISSTDGRFKKSEKCENFKSLLDRGIVDYQYGLCKPQIIINYNRNYFSYKNFRITLDKDINYLKYYKDNKFSPAFNDDEIVAEVKGIKVDQDFLDQNFPFTSARFSKYCRGVDLINQEKSSSINL